ncbi:uncharacterized protein LOC134538438 [Bacillus rossius redtenbacheri]|uniref:uncharacterized protein LOC134538438 n=1 Tax=Bacillus rossius redtenbacheri TaxID=93214 RepID=UPI002FDE6F6B
MGSSSKYPAYYEQQLTDVEDRCDTMTQKLNSMKTINAANDSPSCHPDGDRQFVSATDSGLNHGNTSPDSGTAVNKGNNKRISSTLQAKVTVTKMIRYDRARETPNVDSAQNEYEQVYTLPNSYKNEPMHVCNTNYHEATSDELINESKTEQESKKGNRLTRKKININASGTSKKSHGGSGSYDKKQKHQNSPKKSLTMVQRTASFIVHKKGKQGLTQKSSVKKNRSKNHQVSPRHCMKDDTSHKKGAGRYHKLDTLMQNSLKNRENGKFENNVPTTALSHTSKKSGNKSTENTKSSDDASKRRISSNSISHKSKGSQRSDPKVAQTKPTMNLKARKIDNPKAAGDAPVSNRPHTTPFVRRNFPRRLEQPVYQNIPFVPAKSTTPSHNLKLNVQTALSLIKLKGNTYRSVNCALPIQHGNGKGDSVGLRRQTVNYKSILSHVLNCDENAPEGPAFGISSSPECGDQPKGSDNLPTRQNVLAKPPVIGKSDLYSVLKKLYGDFKDMDKRMEQLKEAADSSESNAELEDLEKQLQAKEVEINVVVQLYEDATLLRHQLQAVSSPFAMPARCSHYQPFPRIFGTTNSVRLTKVLRAVQRFQDHLKGTGLVA